MRLALIFSMFALPALADDLRSPADFATIADDQARAEAIFAEAAKVFQHPRCSNCHPVGERPFQGNDPHPHQPHVIRGDGGFGAPGGMVCTTCHGAENYEASGVPGNPVWHLAPTEMGWHGRSVGEICAQISNPEMTGGRDLTEVIEHLAEDELVHWGWAPGADREPAPGSAEALVELMEAWVAAGAHCPA
ncbi:Isoquinoline 1-oxidoreductase subunit [Pontivivens insulae]|uniref:Cytochrome c domain-containing protein n=1 Tax=Pontivivens insulae TaxID=1639689 RepID=A0A2R8AAW5_9RHOB|nr:Isoquinoline 1-oxidoreductase subunit [Pontivivens insulae]RED13290.1 hypothetical protein DFR53_2426 [Pontivivens insulae]SPF29382.1 hypothetical protein POI8812_01690 [Pontivivens insulae]